MGGSHNFDTTDSPSRYQTHSYPVHKKIKECWSRGQRFIWPLCHRIHDTSGQQYHAVRYRLIRDQNTSVFPLFYKGTTVNSFSFSFSWVVRIVQRLRWLSRFSKNITALRHHIPVFNYKEAHSHTQKVGRHNK